MERAHETRHERERTRRRYKEEVQELLEPCAFLGLPLTAPIVLLLSTGTTGAAVRILRNIRPE